MTLFWPFFVYATTPFAASALLFAVHVPHGTFIHSAVALLPHTFVLVILGISSTSSGRHSGGRLGAAFGHGVLRLRGRRRRLAGAALQSVNTIGHWREVRDVQARWRVSGRRTRATASCRPTPAPSAT